MFRKDHPVFSIRLSKWAVAGEFAAKEEGPVVEVRAVKPPLPSGRTVIHTGAQRTATGARTAKSAKVR